MSGFFAVFKDVFDDPIFDTKEPMTEREAYLWLCRNAAWKDTTHRVGSEVVDCPKGSVFITLRDFMTTTSWGSDTKVRNFLQRMEDAGLIERSTYGKRNARKTRVTICEYAEIDTSAPEENAPKTHRERTKNAVKEEGNNKQTSEAKASSDIAPAAPLPANDLSEAVATYNTAAEHAGWPKVAKLTPARAKKLKARLKDCGGLSGWQDALRRAYASDFCRNGWKGFGFDSLVSQEKFTRLMEGNYDNGTRNLSAPPHGRGNGSDPALEQIARLAGIG